MTVCLMSDFCPLQSMLLKIKLLIKQLHLQKPLNSCDCPILSSCTNLFMHHNHPGYNTVTQPDFKKKKSCSRDNLSVHYSAALAVYIGRSISVFFLQFFFLQFDYIVYNTLLHEFQWSCIGISENWHFINYYNLVRISVLHFYTISSLIILKYYWS